MKQRELEILLQQVPPYEKPVASLEQYITPPRIAADMIFIAYGFGDIYGKRVVDLGCGTGILSVAASAMGASEVIGVDVDPKCIEIAKSFVRERGFKITFITSNISDIDLHADTIVMNPPFGAQKMNQHADKLFLRKGLEIAPVIYSFHLTRTIPFIKRLLSTLGGEIVFEKKYDFPIKRVFFFHEKEIYYEEVSLIRVASSNSR